MYKINNKMDNNYIILSCYLILTQLTINSWQQSTNIVEIPKQGSIMGIELAAIRTQRIYGYFGIPYAQPPLKNLRFAPPVTNPLPSWDGIKNLTDFKPSCPQKKMESNKNSSDILTKFFSTANLELSEDCLYLNIFVPHGIVPTEGFPVLIWFHPGNFSQGSPSVWDPYNIVFKQRIIIVTFAYRLNIFGFFTTMDGEAPGNFGIMDMTAAIQWTHNNIKLFNGNPKNITLFGYEAGALGAGLHLMPSNGENYFSKVILMNGNVFSSNFIRAPTDYLNDIDYVADFFGCFRYPTSSLMQCLRNADINSLMALYSTSREFFWGPIYDTGLSNTTKAVIPEVPTLAFSRKEYIKVPVLVGYTQMGDVLNINANIGNIEEQGTQVTIQKFSEELLKSDLPIEYYNNSCSPNFVVKSVTFYYTPPMSITTPQLENILIKMHTDKIFGSTSVLLASHMVQDIPDVYVYRFDYKPQTKTVVEGIPEWVTAPQFIDLLFVWGLPYSSMDFSPEDKRMSDILMNLWTNFVKSSDPKKGSLYPIRWDSFNSSDPKLLLLDRNFLMSNESVVNFKTFQFWNDYYTKLLEEEVALCFKDKEVQSNAYKCSSNNFLFIFAFCLLNIYLNKLYLA